MGKFYMIIFLGFFHVSFSQTPGQSFCFCKFNCFEKSETHLALGIQSGINIQKNRKPTNWDIINFRLIANIGFKNYFGTFISAGASIHSTYMENDPLQVKALLNSASGINISIMPYGLIKLSQLAGIYVYPYAGWKLNRLVSNKRNESITFNQILYGVGLEIIFKRILFLGRPVVFSGTLMQNHLNEDKYSQVFGTKTSSLKSLKLGVMMNFTVFKILSGNIHTDALLSKNRSPFYSLSVSMIAPRFDEFIKFIYLGLTEK